MRISIHILTRDRFNELALLLQSLRSQTYQDFDVILVDQSKPAPIFSNHFLMSIINRMKLENHCFKIEIDNITGCCHGRNKCIEIDYFDNPLTLRLDDDVILEPDYIEKLMKGIEKYDLVSGVIPILSQPEWIRKVEKIGKIINEHKLDSEGNLTEMKDECGYCYDEEKLIPTHHFRTNALYKSNKNLKYPTHLSPVAFREEGFFSLKAIIDFNYKLGVNTGAIAYHLQTPSGGNRCQNYSYLVQQDHQLFLNWIKKKFKEKGDFINKYNESLK